MRLAVEEKWPVQKHLLEWNQFVRKLFQQNFLLRAPLVNATATKLAFFVAKESKLIGFRNKFLPINIVQPKAQPFDFVFDMLPENGLDAAPFRGKNSKLNFFIQIFGDD